MCVGITIIKWDSTCHSQTHGTEPPVHFCCSHYISTCFLSTPPLSFSLSLLLSLSLSLSFSLSLYLCPLFLSVVARHMSSDALYQIFSSWSILLFHTISFHSSYKIHQLFTDYLLRLPSSELLEKHLFRSRANRRLVLYIFVLRLQWAKKLGDFPWQLGGVVPCGNDSWLQRWGKFAGIVYYMCNICRLCRYIINMYVHSVIGYLSKLFGATPWTFALRRQYWVSTLVDSFCLFLRLPHAEIAGKEACCLSKKILEHIVRTWANQKLSVAKQVATLWSRLVAWSLEKRLRMSSLKRHWYSHSAGLCCSSVLIPPAEVRPVFGLSVPFAAAQYFKMAFGS